MDILYFRDKFYKKANKWSDSITQREDVADALIALSNIYGCCASTDTF